MGDRRTEGELGQAASFEALYRREFGPVVALAYVLSGSRAAAEELAQESFLAALRRWDDISTYEQPAAWIRRVCINRSTSLVRKRVSEAKAAARLAGRRILPEELPPEADEFWLAVRRLPRRQAQVIALRYLDDLPVPAIAAILDCAEATVRVHLHRARRALADELGCQAGDDDPGADA